MNLISHIANVKIENFANHKNTFVTFDKGVNIVTGTSDSGKTSLIRAIMFVLDNSYSGSFVNKSPGVKFAKVTIEFSDGRIISRMKGDSVNRVEFKNPDDTEFTVFSNFKTKYPEAVIKFLGNLPLDEESKALYYAKQSKKLFLINQSSQSMPNTLSILLNISDLEEASKSLNSEALSLEKLFKSKTLEHDSLENEIKEKYEFLDDNLKTLSEFKKFIDEAKELQDECDDIQNYNSKLKNIRTKFSELSEIISFNNKIVDNLSDSLDSIEDIGDDCNEIKSYISKYDNYVSDKQKLEEDLEQITQICDETFKDSVDTIEELSATIANLKFYISEIKSISQSIKDKTKEINDVNDQIAVYQKEYDEIKKYLVDNDMICNTCNRFGGEEV